MSPTKGVIVAWKAEKGFGFIRPEGGGMDVFVHIRDFGTISRQPTIGDKVTYQPMKGEDGRLRAADVRVAGLPRIPKTKAASSLPRMPAKPKASRLLPIGIVLLILVAFAAYWNLTNTTSAPETRQIVHQEQETPAERFRCEGKQYCSEMSSCAEARYYLRHCPGTEMDGDGDRRPCEDRCGH